MRLRWLRCAKPASCASLHTHPYLNHCSDGAGVAEYAEQRAQQPVPAPRDELEPLLGDAQIG